MVDADTTSFTRTLRLKVKAEAYPWLNAAAVEVNQIFNYANEASFDARRRTDLKSKWLSGFDLCNLTAGSTEYFEHIGADTIQRICTEYAAKRAAAKRLKLRWRVSRGARRSLGWIPFKTASLKRKGGALRFCGKTFRVFDREYLADHKFRDGCFAQDACGDWWLCVPVEVRAQPSVAPREAVGIDLGLKAVATTSDGEVLEAGRMDAALCGSPRPSSTARSQAPSKADSPERRAMPRRCLAQVFEEDSRQLSDDIRWRREQLKAGKDADGKVRARLRLGHAQDAVAVQRPAGR
jgi:hypothetical protein